MSMPYPQQPAGQPAVPAQPVQQVPQGVPQVGMPAQPAYQGGAPGYAPVPQGPVVQRVNWASITLGIVGWVLIGLTVLVMWLAIESSASDPDPTGKEVYGFLPLFALMFIGPANLAGGIIGIVGAVGKPKTRKLNWLGILLNASPYVVFAILMIVVIVAAAGTSHASMMIVGARPTMASL